jgi:HlyD family secretion protein
MNVPARRSKRRIFLIIAAVIVVVGIGLAIYGKRKAAGKGEAVTTEKAQIRTVTQVVTATGKIQPEIEVKISPEVYGEILEMPHREGMRVKKGDLMVRIKSDLYQAQVDQQTAAVASARGAAINSAAKVERANQDLKRYTDLHSRSLASDSDYVLYKTNFDVAKADLVSATANVEQAEGLLKQARDALSKTKIYSPMDGTVSSRSSEVGERVVATGQFTGTEIMRVADLSNMEVQVNVNENDVPHVKVGDHAVLSIDAYPDRKFNGVVKEIASSAENAGATGSGSSTQASGASADEVTNFLVRIRVSDRDIQLRPGMSATADIETQTVAKTVTVPIQSVTERDSKGLSSDEARKQEADAQKEKSGNDLMVSDEKAESRRRREERRRVVFVKTGDKVRMQPVTTGIADATYIEIKSGVKEGDEVVSGTYAAISRKLKDGSKVFIEPPKKTPESAP